MAVPAEWIKTYFKGPQYIFFAESEMKLLFDFCFSSFAVYIKLKYMQVTYKQCGLYSISLFGVKYFCLLVFQALFYLCVHVWTADPIFDVKRHKHVFCSTVVFVKMCPNFFLPSNLISSVFVGFPQRQGKTVFAYCCCCWVLSKNKKIYHINEKLDQTHVPCPYKP